MEKKSHKNKVVILVWEIIGGISWILESAFRKNLTKGQGKKYRSNPTPFIWRKIWHHEFEKNLGFPFTLDEVYLLSEWAYFTVSFRAKLNSPPYQSIIVLSCLNDNKSCQEQPISCNLGTANQMGYITSFRGLHLKTSRAYSLNRENIC